MDNNVVGQIRPESSKLTCSEIKGLIGARPPAPETYVIMEPSQRQWKCHLPSPGEGELLMLCKHHRMQFSVVAAR